MIAKSGSIILAFIQFYVLYVHVDMYDLLLVARAEHKTSRAGAKTDESGRTFGREKRPREQDSRCAHAQINTSIKPEANSALTGSNSDTNRK